MILHPRALALLLLTLPLRAAVIRGPVAGSVTGALLLAVAPIPALAPLAPVLSAPSAGVPLAAAPAPILNPERAERAATIAALWTELPKVPSLTEPAAYAKADGLRAIALPFEGQTLLGLHEDNLAQFEPEDKLVHFNWDMIGPDRRAYEAAGLSAVESRRVVALSLAPAAGHEFLHARLRSEFGAPFPGLKEEEILTHIAQAEAFDEVLRLNPDLERLKPLLDRGFLFPHNRKVWERWREGFGALASHVLRKYGGTPSLGDDPAERAAQARALIAAWEAAPGTVAPVWITRAKQAAQFWEDPAEVRRLTAFIQARIDLAYARFTSR
jgi:hypothetical protein